MVPEERSGGQIASYRTVMVLKLIDIPLFKAKIQNGIVASSIIFRKLPYFTGSFFVDLTRVFW